MSYPEFFDEIAPIELSDPLAKFLGAFDDGLVNIEYLDVVRVAGHSCPTVAGAYLMASHGLSVLYEDMEIPVRGNIKVEFGESTNEGVTGVIANVLGFITGAAGQGGFKGIGGQFTRQNLLDFDKQIQGNLRMTRTDTGKTVSIEYHPEVIPPDPQIAPLMKKAISGAATEEEETTFKRLWQERVQKILCDQSKHSELVKCIKQV